MDQKLLQARARLNIYAAGLQYNVRPPITSTPYALVYTDAVDSFLVFDSLTPQEAVIDKNIYQVGDVLRIYRQGAGTLEIVEGAGVTFVGLDDGAGKYWVNQWSVQTLVAVSSNEFLLLATGQSVGGPHTIGSHTDVVVTSATLNDVLLWNESAWENRALTEEDISDLHVHANKSLIDLIDQDLRETSTPTFDNIISNQPAVLNHHVPRLDQLQSAVLGLSWLEPVESQTDLSSAEPSSPNLGDRYVNTNTGTGTATGTLFTQNYIYEWNGSAWDEFSPAIGWAVWDKDTDINITFNGTEWVDFAGTSTHNSLLGLQGGTSGEYYHLTETEHGRIGDWDTAFGWGDHAGLYALIDHVHGEVDVWRKEDQLTVADDYTETITHAGDVLLNGAPAVSNYQTSTKSLYVNGDIGITGNIASVGVTSWLTVTGNRGIRLHQEDQNVGSIEIGSKSLGVMSEGQTGGMNVNMGRNFLVSPTSTTIPTWHNLVLSSAVDFSPSPAILGNGVFNSIYINPTINGVGTHYAFNAESGQLRVADYPNTRNDGVLVNYLGTDTDGNVVSGQISDLTIGGGDTSTGLEQITENSQTGWRYIGSLGDNYGDIGNYATDLSYSGTTSNTAGATGDYSLSAGEKTTSSGKWAYAGGYITVSSGTSAFSHGEELLSSGAISFTANKSNVAAGKSSASFGENNLSSSYGEFTLGINGTQYAPLSVNSYNELDRVFNIGIGSSPGALADGLTVLKSGMVTTPSLSISMIDAGSGKTQVTKEWVNYLVSGGSGDFNSIAFHTQTTASITWTFTHNLGTLDPIIQVRDVGGNVIIPKNIVAAAGGTDINVCVITFPTGYPLTGRATAIGSGGVFYSGIEEAPEDGSQYVRQSAEWVTVSSSVGSEGYRETGTQANNNLDATIGYTTENRVNIDENGNVNLFKDGTGSIVSNMTPAEIHSAVDETLVTKGYLNIKTVKVTITAAQIREASQYINGNNNPNLTPVVLVANPADGSAVVATEVLCKTTPINGMYDDNGGVGWIMPNKDLLLVLDHKDDYYQLRLNSSFLSPNYGDEPLGSPRYEKAKQRDVGGFLNTGEPYNSFEEGKGIIFLFNEYLDAYPGTSIELIVKYQNITF